MIETEKLVTALSQLFETPGEEIIAALEKDDSFNPFVEKLKTERIIYKKEDFDKLLQNKQAEYLDAHAKSEKIHKPIYDRVAGTVKEMTEKEIAKHFGITEEYKGMKELFEKVEAKLKVAPDNSETEKQIADLKALVLQVEKEKDEALSNKTKEVDQFILSAKMTEWLDEADLDYENEALKHQKKYLEVMFREKYDLIRKDKNIIAVSRDTNEVVKDRVGDPVDPAGLLREFAPTVGVNLKKVPTGGRGDEGSHTNKSTKDLSNINNEDDLVAYFKANGIKMGSKESQDVLIRIKKANPKFKM